MSWRGRPWMALLPVVMGVLAWWLLWDRGAGRWERELTAAIMEPRRVVGFPYRLEAQFGPLAVARAHGGAAVEARAASATLERAFGRSWPHVFAAQDLVLRAEAPALASVALGIEAARVRGSIDLGGRRLNRLSLQFADARLATGWLGRDLRAPEAELHLRQSSGAAPQPDGRPGPVAELVVTSPAVRLGDGGAPLMLSLRATLVQRGVLASVRDWTEAGGTMRIDEIVLADATGPVLRLVGSAMPREGVGAAMALDAVVTTACPATVLATLAGVPAAPEHRRRLPVTLELTGPPGRPIVTPSPEAMAERPVKRQEPPCPRLTG